MQLQIDQYARAELQLAFEYRRVHLEFVCILMCFMLAGSEFNNKCLVQVERLSLHFPMANQHARSLKLYLEPNGYRFLFIAFRHIPIYIALNG